MSNSIDSVSHSPSTKGVDGRMRAVAGITTLLVMLGCQLLGCGYGEYELRLNESRKYYAYLDKIEQSLSPKWAASGPSGNVMDLRVPRQFLLIPAPQPVKKPDGTLEYPEIDPRQPDYISLKLPGLFGAWYSDFVVARTDGSKEDRKGYIYALSNYDELAGEHAVDAGEFVTTMKTLFTETLGVPISDERTEVHPKVLPAYQVQVSYDAFSFKGKNIEGVNYTFDVFSRAQGSVISALVIVLPEGMESPQKVTERIPMMLESFNFTRVPPKPGATTTAPAAQGATPTGGF